MGSGASAEQRFRKPNARRVNLFNILQEMMKDTKREEDISDDHWQLLMKALEAEEHDDSQVKQLREELEKERAGRERAEDLVAKLQEYKDTMQEVLKAKGEMQAAMEKELAALRDMLQQKDEGVKKTEASAARSEAEVAAEDKEAAADCKDVHDAARKSLAAVRHFLREDPGAVDKRDEHKSTPLFPAARRGHGDVAQFLLAARANVNARNDFNDIPLDWAASSGHGDVMKILIDTAAQRSDQRILVEAEPSASHLEAKDGSGQTAS
ncbi:ANKEF1 [Symbiodinium natans]|uniref:ANKEF1 protein n=1 Tax=Symbiodinium natans TaxID=878477 RepID=A0A812QM37_9DINO|nr:ANKEF1 [Symbiodinium natans]